jgi:predicted metal-dependent hydrolase
MMKADDARELSKQTETLHRRLVSVYEEMKRNERFELSRDLDFRVTKRIDGKRERVAKLKGNRVFVTVDAVSLPRSALKYVVAHEVAHKFTKRHSERFWQVVENLYPSYEKGRNALEQSFSSQHYVEGRYDASNCPLAGD